MRSFLHSLLCIFVFLSLCSVNLAVAEDKPEAKKETAPELVVQPPKPSEEEHRFVPIEGFHNESEEIESAVDRRWRLLTYPKDTIPPMALTHGRQWIKDNVPEGKLWKDVPNLQFGSQESEMLGPITPQNGTWTLVGPRPMTMTTQLSGYKYGTVIGRFDALAVHPTNNSIVYTGSPSGGLWKTTNCCSVATTWAPLWDGELTTQAVGAIEFDPSDVTGNTLYVGTGDFDARDQFGQGIMKTTDAGATWTLLGASTFSPYSVATNPGNTTKSNQNIGSIKVDPNNPSTVVVGTYNNFFISHDSGGSWGVCNIVASTTVHQRVSSMVIDASTNPTTVYAAIGYPYPQVSQGGDIGGANSVYRATIPGSGCPTFTRISASTNGWPAATGTGNPAGNQIGRIRLARSQQNSQILYALVSYYASTSDCKIGAHQGLYVTQNALNANPTWTALTDPETFTGTCNLNQTDFATCGGGPKPPTGQDWYDLFMMVNPNNDRNLIIGRTDLFSATVNNAYNSVAFTNLSTVYAVNLGTNTPLCPSYGSMHPDQHSGAWIGTTTEFLVGNDGGIYKGTGAAGTFTVINSNFNTTQWYAGQTSANVANAAQQIFFGGSQDNGNASWDSSNTDLTWQARNGGGDGFFTAFDSKQSNPLTQGVAFTEYPGGAVYRSTSGITGTYAGSLGCQVRCDWSTPFMMDNFHCTNTTCNNVLYGDARPIHTPDGGTSWYFSAAGDITKGSSDTVISMGLAQNSPTTAILGTAQGAVRWTNNLFTGANCTQAAANTASFSCTQNSATWVDLTLSNAVLPNRAILGVAVDPSNNQRVYAAIGGFNTNTPGTPGHIYRATCSSDCTTAANWTWVDKSGNLPDIPAEAIVINPNNFSQAFVGTMLGFFYTENINAATPIWHQYNVGLPVTVIRYLTLDRGPALTPYASTTLTAFTYGRGTYAIRLPASAGAKTSFAPYPVEPTMTAEKNGGNEDVVYPSANCPNDNHNIYWGNLGDFVNVTGGACGVGTTGLATVSIPAGSWFVITGSDGSSTVANFGSDSNDVLRSLNGWAAICPQIGQNNTTTCP